MSAELDMSQYLDLFLQEAEEQLGILEAETLKLESNATLERLNVIFRAAHTLKGSSRAMGYVNFAAVTHEMENVLDLLRSGGLALTREITDTLLACIDALKEIKDTVASGQGDNLDCSLLVSRVQGFAAGAHMNLSISPTKAQLSDELTEVLKMVAEIQPVYLASFTLVPDCVMKFARVFMAVNTIQDGGELLASIPDREALEEEQFGDEFHLYFHHVEGLESIQKRLESISEVKRLDLVEWKPETASDPISSKEKLSSTVSENELSETSHPTMLGRKADMGQTVRVDVARLDELMNLVGELVIDRTRISQIGAALAAKYEFDQNIEALAETVGHITRITGDLQDQIMKARMLPIETVFNRFPRMVRDLSQKAGKDIRLELLGGDTELDRSVVEVIGDPILHLLRNSVDHGVELPQEREKAGKPKQGRITVLARHQENHIIIEIEDDGRGIDPEKVKQKAIEQGLVSREVAGRLTEKECLQFIFASGLSTAQAVSEVSGRGVGMDIVRSNIQKLGGIIDVETTRGQGTRFCLRLPLTLAIIRGLLVEVAQVVYAIPLGSVVETLLIRTSEVQSLCGRDVVVIRGLPTPLIRLREVFQTQQSADVNESDHQYVVVVGLAEQRVGLVVDRLVGEQEVVIKSLSRYCDEAKGISGATILGNGHVALIVDVNGIMESEKTG